MSLGARKNLMDERSTSALQYGHIGEAIYLPETQSWSFSRSLTQRKLFNICKKKVRRVDHISSIPDIVCRRNENRRVVASNCFPTVADREQKSTAETPPRPRRILGIRSQSNPLSCGHDDEQNL
jgi:hypothetical protein